MARIVFLNPFSNTEITGGIKTAHCHAEMLGEMGFDAFVYQPGGPPTWFASKAKLLATRNFTTEPGDVLVFPEVLSGMLAELAQAPLKAKKILFCQNQFYTLFNAVPPARYASLGFERAVCPSAIAKGFLERVLKLRDVAIIPCAIDPDLFHPRPKTQQIAFIPKKLPREAAIIQSAFALKYPQLRTAWQAIDNRSERETADIFGRSTVVLSLSSLEILGLVPLEAMASGAIVVGFTGYGGQEYATRENGFWFPADHLEEVADALAQVVNGLERRDPTFLRVLEAGMVTAAHHSKERTRAALRDFYGALM